MIVILFLILISIIILYTSKHNYKIQLFHKIDEKSYPLKKLYPVSYYLIEQMKSGKRGQSIYNKYIWPDDREKNIYSISIGEDKNQANIIWQCQKISMLILLLFVITTFGILLWYTGNQQGILLDNKYIVRPAYGEGEDTLSLEAHMDGTDEIEVYSYELQIDEQKYTKENVESCFEEFCFQIESIVLDSNKSMDYITSSMVFPKHIPNTFIPLKWSTSNLTVLDSTGELHTENIQEDTIIEVTVKLDYMAVKLSYIFFVHAIKSVESTEVSKEKQLHGYLEEVLSNTRTDNKIELASNIDGTEILWKEKPKNKYAGFFLFGCGVMILYLFLDKKQVDKMLRIRDEQMLYDYSEIVSKLSMYLRAGMSLSVAWGKIVEYYQSTKTLKRYAYEEMVVSYNEMRLGESETKVLERFGKRVKLPCYLRFSSLISSNIQKGNASLLNHLEYEVVEAFMERKEIIKRLGEEAGTKLLIPMMIMLVLVLLIIMIPAYLSFQL